ncbi:YbgS-like protein [Kosakonia oryzendophytica]|uniref:YbgS-like protein n=1 Tax=Kosakonia oryzendophytica TaxID=1005665 RepID=A0A1C4B7L3_9ENTR|nr:protein YbgS [Kosakonia oryzendophytica]TDT60356.1 YbgS-like protein [Enterobacter sp. AG5470]WBT60655.1 protein YbgS [Kosakonia oryzendophytica]SCC02702.1 YbgS-like protein [Kosakonia oryzendophytica]
MKMNKLATLFLTTTLALSGGAAWAADTTSGTTDSSNGQANAAAAAGQPAPDAHQNLVPKESDSSKINTGDSNSNSGTMQHPNGTTSSTQHMSKDEVHKNSMCKDGRCPDINKKVETGNGSNNDVNTKTDGTTQ